MNPLMGFKVRTLGVNFCAARKITVVDSTLLQLGIVASVVLDCNNEKFNYFYNFNFFIKKLS